MKQREYETSQLRAKWLVYSTKEAWRWCSRNCKFINKEYAMVSRSSKPNFIPFVPFFVVNINWQESICTHKSDTFNCRKVWTSSVLRYLIFCLQICWNSVWLQYKTLSHWLLVLVLTRSRFNYLERQPLVRLIVLSPFQKIKRKKNLICKRHYGRSPNFIVSVLKMGFN